MSELIEKYEVRIKSLIEKIDELEHELDLETQALSRELSSGERNPEIVRDELCSINELDLALIHGGTAIKAVMRIRLLNREVDVLTAKNINLLRKVNGDPRA